MWTAGALVAVVPLLGGCEQKAVSETVEARTNGVTPADPLALALEQPAPATTNPPPLAEPGTNRPVVADHAAAESKPLPPGLAVSPSLGHVVKMANAGVEPGVMLSFITNSAGTFNLGAEQIIFLKDLGLQGEVVTTMILHDQAISSGQFQVTASTVPTPSAAPTPEVGPTAPAANTTSVWQNGQPTNANPYAPTYAEQPAAPTPPVGEVAQLAPQPQVPATTASFQESLSPYGNWVTVEGYGTCWQPTVTVINTAWRPYCDGGRWLYTDCGWYWQSDYAWGGVAFHYGRWFYAPRHGWCWWPNTVWGPSWVTWRSASAYCGWAPLPPYSYYNAGVGFTYYGNNVSVGFGFGLGAGCYTFVPWNGFCQSRPWAYAVPHHRVGPIYHESTVVNHVAVGPNRAMINHGIEVNQVTARAGREVPRGTVHEVQGGHGAIQPDRVERQGNQHIVYRAAPSAGREMNGAPHGAESPASRPASTTARPGGSNNGRPVMTTRGNEGSREFARPNRTAPETPVARRTEMPQPVTPTPMTRPTPPVSPFTPTRTPQTAATPATPATSAPRPSRAEQPGNSTRPVGNGRSNPWRSQPGAANNPAPATATPSAGNNFPPATRPTPPVSPFTPTITPQTAATPATPATPAPRPSRAEQPENSARPVGNGRSNPWRSQPGVANNPAPATAAPSAGNNSPPATRTTSPPAWNLPPRTPTYSRPVAPQYSVPTAPRPSPSISMPQPPQRPTYTPPTVVNRAPVPASPPTYSAPARTYSAPPTVASSPVPAPAFTPRSSGPASSRNNSPGGRSGRNVNER